MTSGGARSRSGPLPDERSGRSERRGYRLDELPAEGYSGTIPAFPLPEPSDREIEVWEQLWRTPQACAWSQPSEQWRHRIVALYVRQSVKCESPGIGAGQLAQLHRFADQVGLTDAGLAAMGWKIARAEATRPVVELPSSQGPRVRRLRAEPESARERARRASEGRPAWKA